MSISNLPLMSKEMVHDLKMKIAEDIEKQLSLSPVTLNQPSGRDYERLLKLEQSLKEKIRWTVELSFRTLINGNGSRKSKTNISINKVL